VFDKLGQFAGLMRNLPRIQEELGKFQEKLGQLVATGDAGAGMVTVTANGRMEVLRCAISDEAMRAGDREMLEDLIRAATNQALTKARELVQEETGKMASGLGLPSGMGLPGLGQ
jgi:DNA-binding YbaB/EbfC family protein